MVTKPDIKDKPEGLHEEEQLIFKDKIVCIRTDAQKVTINDVLIVRKIPSRTIFTCMNSM